MKGTKRGAQPSSQTAASPGAGARQTRARAQVDEADTIGIAASAAAQAGSGGSGQGAGAGPSRPAGRKRAGAAAPSRAAGSQAPGGEAAAPGGSPGPAQEGSEPAQERGLQGQQQPPPAPQAAPPQQEQQPRPQHQPQPSPPRQQPRQSPQRSQARSGSPSDTPPPQPLPAGEPERTRQIQLPPPAGEGQGGEAAQEQHGGPRAQRLQWRLEEEPGHQPVLAWGRHAGPEAPLPLPRAGPGPEPPQGGGGGAAASGSEGSGSADRRRGLRPPTQAEQMQLIQHLWREERDKRHTLMAKFEELQRRYDAERERADDLHDILAIYVTKPPPGGREPQPQPASGEGRGNDHHPRYQSRGDAGGTFEEPWVGRGGGGPQPAPLPRHGGGHPEGPGDEPLGERRWCGGVETWAPHAREVRPSGGGTAAIWPPGLQAPPARDQRPSGGGARGAAPHDGYYGADYQAGLRQSGGGAGGSYATGAGGGPHAPGLGVWQADSAGLFAPTTGQLMAGAASGRSDEAVAEQAYKAAKEHFPRPLGSTLEMSGDEPLELAAAEACTQTALRGVLGVFQEEAARRGFPLQSPAGPAAALLANRCAREGNKLAVALGRALSGLLGSDHSHAAGQVREQAERAIQRVAQALRDDAIGEGGEVWLSKAVKLLCPGQDCPCHTIVDALTRLAQHHRVLGRVVGGVQVDNVLTTGPSLHSVIAPHSLVWPLLLRLQRIVQAVRKVQVCVSESVHNGQNLPGAGARRQQSPPARGPELDWALPPQQRPRYGAELGAAAAAGPPGYPGAAPAGRPPPAAPKHLKPTVLAALGMGLADEPRARAILLQQRWCKESCSEEGCQRRDCRFHHPTEEQLRALGVGAGMRAGAR